MEQFPQLPPLADPTLTAPTPQAPSLGMPQLSLDRSLAPPPGLTPPPIDVNHLLPPSLLPQPPWLSPSAPGSDALSHWADPIPGGSAPTGMGALSGALQNLGTRPGL